jgi:FkbM family methyltransferase
MKEFKSNEVNVLYFDIGAYVGDKVGEYLSLGVDKIIAVEPNPESYASLKARYQDNPKVVTVNKAVSDKIGEADLIVPSANLITLSTLDPEHWFTGRFAGLTEAKRFQVRTTTLDALIKKYGKPDFLKVDCEGWEEHVIAGLTQPVPRLSFEFSIDHLDSLLRCLYSLRRLGKYHCQVDGSGPLTPYKLYKELKMHGDWGDVSVIYDL